MASGRDIVTYIAPDILYKDLGKLEKYSASIAGNLDEI
jgi:hypothetical protein